MKTKLQGPWATYERLVLLALRLSPSPAARALSAQAGRLKRRLEGRVPMRFRPSIEAKKA